MEMEGKKISAQLEYLDFENAEKERREFEETYKLKGLTPAEKTGKNMPKKVD